MIVSEKSSRPASTSMIQQLPYNIHGYTLLIPALNHPGKITNPLSYFACSIERSSRAAGSVARSEARSALSLIQCVTTRTAVLRHASTRKQSSIVSADVRSRLSLPPPQACPFLPELRPPTGNPSRLGKMGNCESQEAIAVTTANSKIGKEGSSCRESS